VLHIHKPQNTIHTSYTQHIKLKQVTTTMYCTHMLKQVTTTMYCTHTLKQVTITMYCTHMLKEDSWHMNHAAFYQLPKWKGSAFIWIPCTDRFVQCSVFALINCNVPEISTKQVHERPLKIHESCNTWEPCNTSESPPSASFSLTDQ